MAIKLDNRQSDITLGSFGGTYFSNSWNTLNIPNIIGAQGLNWQESYAKDYGPKPNLIEKLTTPIYKGTVGTLGLIKSIYGEAKQNATSIVSAYQAGGNMFQAGIKKLTGGTPDEVLQLLERPTALEKYYGYNLDNSEDMRKAVVGAAMVPTWFYGGAEGGKAISTGLLGIGQKILRGAKVGGQVGAIFGAGQTFASDEYKKPISYAKNIGTGAVLGAVTGGALEGVLGVASNILNKDVIKKLKLTESVKNKRIKFISENKSNQYGNKFDSDAFYNSLTPDEQLIYRPQVSRDTRFDSVKTGIWHGSDGGKLKIDNSGNINFSNTRANVTRFGDPVQIDTSGLKLLEIKDKDNLFRIANTPELKNKYIKEGIDIIFSDNHYIGINTEKIINKTGLSKRVNPLNRPIGDLFTPEPRSQARPIPETFKNAPEGIIEPSTGIVEQSIIPTSEIDTALRKEGKPVIPTKTDTAARAILDIPMSPEIPLYKDLIMRTTDKTGWFGKQAQKLMVFGKDILKSMGKAGSEFANLMEHEKRVTRQQGGKWKSKAFEIYKDMTRSEKGNFWEYVHSSEFGGKAPTEPKQIKWKQLHKQLTDDIYNLSKSAGLEGGYQEEFYPLFYEFGEDLFPGGNVFAERKAGHLERGRMTMEERIQAIMDKKYIKEVEMKNLTPEQKQTYIDNARKKAEYDVTLFEKNYEKAMTAYIDKAAARISETTFYGKNDSIVRKFLGKDEIHGNIYKEVLEKEVANGASAQVAEKTALEAEMWARHMFGLHVGDKSYMFNQGAGYNSKLVAALGQYNALTKLDWSLITNATQSANIGIKFGGVNEWFGAKPILQMVSKSLLDAFDSTAKLMNVNLRDTDVLKPVMEWADKITKYGLESGANRPQVYLQELGRNVSSIKSLDKLTQWVLSGFANIERNNRAIASVTTHDWILNQAKRLGKLDAETSTYDRMVYDYLGRQLKSLGLDIKDVEKGITPELILRGSQLGSDLTQFDIAPLQLPPAFQHDAVKLLVQFKSFAVKQTEFLYNEVIKEVTKGNPFPLMRLVALSIPASIIANGISNWIRNKNTPEVKNGRDVIDRYFKAVGGIPVDLIAQYNYVAEKLSKSNTSDVGRVAAVFGSIGGPSVSTAAELTSSLWDALVYFPRENLSRAKGKEPVNEWLNLERFLLKQVPLIGDTLLNVATPYPAKEQTLSSQGRIKNAIIKKDKEAFNKAINEYKPEQQGAAIKDALISIYIDKEPDKQFFYDARAIQNPEEKVKYIVNKLNTMSNSKIRNYLYKLTQYDIISDIKALQIKSKLEINE
jgi:hypothetical protein